ncbi:MAG: HU family DNA-binding protein [Candidatus Firestonebacteria bacterium]
MAKTDIVQRIADIAKINKAEAGRSLDGLVAYITTEVKVGNKVKVAGLGTFVMKERAARKARNPKTGAMVDVPAKKTVRFRASKSLKQAVI